MVKSNKYLQKKNGKGGNVSLESCGTVIPQRDFRNKKLKTSHSQIDKTPPRTRTPMCAPPQGRQKVKNVDSICSSESLYKTTIHKILIEKFNVRKWLYYKMQ